MKAAGIQTAVNGFGKIGFQPLNSKDYKGQMFEPAKTTDMPVNNGNVPKTHFPEPLIPQKLCQPLADKETSFNIFLSVS